MGNEDHTAELNGHEKYVVSDLSNLTRIILLSLYINTASGFILARWMFSFFIYNSNFNGNGTSRSM